MREKLVMEYKKMQKQNEMQTRIKVVNQNSQPDPQEMNSSITSIHLNVNKPTFIINKGF